MAATVATALAGAWIVAACSEITPTSFGNPNALDRKNIPGEGGVELLLCSGDASAEGGGFDGGCPSFATDIYPYFKAGGAWRCADKACHGGATAPTVADTNAAACLASLKKITVTGAPYVTTAADSGADASTSSLLCNLQGTCGSPMPKAPGIAPTSSELCMVEAWLKCGSPP